MSSYVRKRKTSSQPSNTKSTESVPDKLHGQRLIEDEKAETGQVRNV